MELNVKSLTVLVSLLIAPGAITYSQTESLDKFLYYTNKNQKVDEIYFYDLNRKIVRGTQQEPGPLSVYLMDRFNLICDTLDHKILPEFILFGSKGNVYVTGSTKFEHIQIRDTIFQEIEQFSTLESAVENVKGMWRVLKFNQKLVGLFGSGKKISMQIVDLESGDKTVLIPAQSRLTITNQKMLDVNYFLSDEFLFVFIVPYQKLFKINRTNFSVSEILFPYSNNMAWYYFYDHIKSQHYLVRDKGSKYSLHLFTDDTKLLELTDLIAIPRAIVDGNLHMLERTKEGTMHYMIPVSSSERAERAASNFMLKEVVIKP